MRALWALAVETYSLQHARAAGAAHISNPMQPHLCLPYRKRMARRVLVYHPYRKSALMYVFAYWQGLQPALSVTTVLLSRCCASAVVAHSTSVSSSSPTWHAQQTPPCLQAPQRFGRH
jgi:hypothetical protein